ncbi:type II toxin-antitoxin system VapC family toxin [Thiococcus pfennigii]|uniref:type II toxin-antitoxin system VapC family toxin n=1 Tax=Thiococcus pfennigii TaxID=1057 RepID=UPI001904E3F9|nr:PIN domain-containing protein [Thiococcus pfennigii]MBK1733337.1 VapC toxin family PIN domain ribonuclease [Thiococcus pfennigii]
MIIADTGFWLALANRRDDWHQAATAWLARSTEGLITTWPVATETCHLLLSRLGEQPQQAFIHSLRDGAAELFALDCTHLPRIAELMGQYADLPMDLADASLVVLAEALGHGRILSTDERDFQTYRWKRHAPFDNQLSASLPT